MKPASLALAFALVTGLTRAGAAQASPGFDHLKHARLFPRCESCHVGAVDGSSAMWPSRQSCETCHDGTAVRQISWAPPVVPRPGMLRFDHRVHRRSVAAASSRITAAPPSCASCHQPSGARRMTVSRTIVGQCLDCHRQAGEHVALPDTACAACHLSLVDAKSLPESRIRDFPTPPSHRSPAFLGAGPAGHGALAKGSGTAVVSASCAVCHARDFCASCHVDAPENRLIQALGLDRRSRAIPAALAAPASHRVQTFARRHGDRIGRDIQKCATCHTRESCLACHAGAVPAGVLQLATAGPGRAVGAVVERKAPATHGADFADRHGDLASAAERSCAACHARTTCLECHRPDPARSSGFHPAGFLSRHPAAAYARENSCSDCHNAQQFCVSCHAQTGSVAGRRALGVGNYHDGRRFFLFGHGQAARQGLESCVSCHVERDCTTCHASAGGRRFNPHGPGFDPNRLRRKNPETCLACHGANIPSR